jgi:sulfite reductase (NADPH) flavoprotein alpha-component
MPTLSIYFATVTGNAEGLARQTETRAQSEGWQPRLHNLSEVKPTNLVADRFALFIVSTWGDGEPPADATGFWYDLEKAALDLSGLRYAVLGLGDKDYQDFNAFARKLDERLTELGAQRLNERIEADLIFEGTYAGWANRVFPLLAVQRTAVSATG